MSDDVYEYIHEVIQVKIEVTADEPESVPVPVKVVKVVGDTSIYVTSISPCANSGTENEVHR